MLVRVSFAEDPSTANDFDEEANRTAQHLESREWDEFMVVWRKRQIELYANWVRLFPILELHRLISVAYTLQGAHARIQASCLRDTHAGS